MTRRIAFVVGDTLGHCYPALAVAETYGRIGALDVQFYGPNVPASAGVVRAHGYPYRLIAAAPLARTTIAGKLKAGLRTLSGIAESRRALRHHGARLVLAFGSYASAPLVLAARTLGLTTVIHEGNVEPGLANRWLARIADRVHVNFAHTSRCFNHGRVLVVGWPIRREIGDLASVRRRIPQPGASLRVLVLGSRGTDESRFLDERAPDLVGALVRRGHRVEVLHRTGATDVDRIEARYAGAHASVTITSIAVPILEALEWADFAVTRSGAGILAELAAAALPSLLVPLADAAADHQTANAQAVAAAGGALWTSEAAWDPAVLAGSIDALLTTPCGWANASAAMRAAARPDAAARVVADCEALMAGRW